MLEFRQVTKIFDGTRTVLEGIDFRMEKGEFLLLVGPNRAGKTTLLRLISLEEFPTKGEIVFDNFSTRTIKKKQIPLLRRKMGRIFPDFQLIDDTNVFDNIAVSLRINGTIERKTKRKVQQVMETLGLFRMARCYPGQLSNGEKQKVACARAMVREPLLLLADEPTLNLDQKSSDEILGLLRQINLLGTSVLLATCDPHLRVGDHAKKIMLEKGKMIQSIRGDIKIPSLV